MIQFFAWIAWFPLLFYTTIYIGDLYKRSTPLSASPTVSIPPALSPEQKLNILLNARDAEATRLGSLALFYSSLLALFVNIMVPMFVAPTASKHSSFIVPSHSSSAGREGALGSLGDEIGSARVGRSGGLHNDRTRSGWWKRIRVPERIKVKLVSLWAVSHLVLAGCLLGTL